MKALLLVDLQHDFLPGGALGVNNGGAIIPLINEMIHYPFDLIVATKDWHPADHRSFASHHQGKKPGDIIHLGGIEQILWPDHCLQGAEGSEFAPGWDTTKIDKVIYKGTDPFIDSYSSFYDNGHRKQTGLENYLREKGVQQLFIAGLATDYCVKYSVLDALKLGFRTYVIVDACRGVNLDPQDSEKALQDMRKGGAVLLSFRDLKELLEHDAKGKQTV
ncbi:MAG: bifunctional nicotinamidase/pyrazinamidase [Parachlamydiaceae bacterium]